MRQTAVNFFSPDGLTLEGIIGAPTGDELPEGHRGGLPGVVYCAPEPHLGGTMLSPVIEALTREVTSRGFMTLRFNYRGVGGSSGENSLGAGQARDAQAAIDMLREWPGVDAGRIGIVGYSYGSGVALRVAAQDPNGLRVVIAVSPILDIPLLGISTLDGLDALRLPVRFLIGENDGLTPPARLREWVRALGNSRMEVRVLEGADRAWQDRRSELAAETAAFLSETLSRAP